MVPAIRAVIDRVQDQTVVLRIGAEVRLVEERVEHRESGLPVARALHRFAVGRKVAAEAQQPLRADRSGRAIDGFVVVEWIGGASEVIAEFVEIGRTGNPSTECPSMGVCWM